MRALLHQLFAFSSPATCNATEEQRARLHACTPHREPFFGPQPIYPTTRHFFFFQKPKVQSIDRFEQLKQAPFCQKPKTGVLNDMIIDHPAFFFHALANGKWSSTARLSLYIYKKNVPARQSLQSIQVTYTFKQTNCFALPGYIQINILPVTCNMHTSTRKLATPKQTTTTNILCMFLSPMLHASMYAQITPSFYTHLGPSASRQRLC